MGLAQQNFSSHVLKASFVPPGAFVAMPPHTPWGTISLGWSSWWFTYKLFGSLGIVTCKALKVGVFDSLVSVTWKALKVGVLQLKSNCRLGPETGNKDGLTSLLAARLIHPFIWNSCRPRKPFLLFGGNIHILEVFSSFILKQASLNWLWLCHVFLDRLIYGKHWRLSNVQYRCNDDFWW